MSVWRRLLRLSDVRDSDGTSSDSRRRRVRLGAVEQMEPKLLMAANPLHVGAVYIEQDLGSDDHGDTILIAFDGGAEGSQLTQVVIDGDQNIAGFTVGDVFFDTLATGLGADKSHPFTIDLHGVDAYTPHYEDGTTRLVIEFEGFDAGDWIEITIDVDEVESYDPQSTDLDLTNEGFDPITSGVEFQDSLFVAHFAAPHFYDAQVTTTFRNRYDDRLQQSGLSLPADDEGGKRDRTAGAFGEVSQHPLPIALSGHVYEERDLDLLRDATEPGIGGVNLTLWQKQGETYVSTGFSTITDATGYYEFARSLGLTPGTYQIREQQPSGYYSVGAIPGTVDGQDSGSIVADNPDVLTEITIPLGNQAAINYDFAESLPASISGFVYHDRNDNGLREGSEEGIDQVSIQAIPLDTVAPQLAVTLTTAADGSYHFTGLAPGRYRIVEVTQPDGYFDGKDTAGTVAGIVTGTAQNPGDLIDDIFLGGGASGIDYNFGELVPVSIQGEVHVSNHDGDCFEDDEETTPLAGVTVYLLNADGERIAETLTDSRGHYQFEGLHPGTYGVQEITPTGLLDGGARAGSVDGQTTGTVVDGGTVQLISLGSGQEGVDYDFCEHEPATLSGYVYHDRDDDGHFNTTEESPIDGVELQLFDIDGTHIASATTDTNGYYEFAGLSKGTYRIVETQPDGWIDGKDTAGTIGGIVVGTAQPDLDTITDILVSFGDRGIDYDFGELLNASLRGRVQLATPDGDCFTDSIEHRPVVGAVVQLYDSTGRLLHKTLTDDDGRYEFVDLLPGEYTVVETTPTGLIDGGAQTGSVAGVPTGIVQDSNTITSVRLLSGDQGTNYDFCEFEPAAISGFVYHDRNNDGLFAISEQGIGGVLVRLVDEQGQIVAEQLTANDGSYRFTDLRAGNYTLSEVQPAGWIDGIDAAGTINGVVVGHAFSALDRIDDVVLRWGDNGIDYDFGEFLPASIQGRVQLSNENGDCFSIDQYHEPVVGAVVRLFDADGNELDRTLTDQNGDYRFDGLAPGIYRVVETTPAGLEDGGAQAGTVAGQTVGNVLDSNTIGQVRLWSGEDGINYLFCEHLFGSIEGLVHTDILADCVFEPANGERPLAGVRIDLLNTGGQVIATTHTDSDGRYRFSDIPAGEYSVREHQVVDYFHGGQVAGSGGGNIDVADVISQIQLGPGERLVDYNFCEIPPGRISGFVFQDGPSVSLVPGEALPERIRDIRDGVKTADDTPLAGVTLELRFALEGRVLNGSEALPGYYPPGPIRTVTDARGFYEFKGLPRGSYAVYEIHPEDYVDGVDTPGTLSGIVFNPGEAQNTAILATLQKSPENDAIVRINLGPGGVAELNNFSEVRVQTIVITLPPPPTLPTPPREEPSVTLLAPLHTAPELGNNVRNPLLNISAGRHVFTWHLSVVDAGFPRGDGLVAEVPPPIWFASLGPESTGQGRSTMRYGRWHLAMDDSSAATGRQFYFGKPGAIPIAGDFNGDGHFEVGVFIDGEWFIDLNGNGVWDSHDLWAKLGHRGDRPVAGDWDGDGKYDIGIFGPIWAGDPRAIVSEPGLPDNNNRPTGQRKNIPPRDTAATNGQRVLKLTEQGKMRGDVIDHVFWFGVPDDVPVVGDWNGDGIHTIGVFRQGRWQFDVDGNGEYTSADAEAQFGQQGDTPIVGDWNGDGVDEIGFVRNGRFYLDSNGNRELDAYDRVFEMGAPGDKPVVGDWNGDGIDDIATYREQSEPAPEYQAFRKAG